MLRASAIALALTAPIALPSIALAQTDACSEQLVRNVEMRMPRISEGLDIRDLSCLGITQIYFLLDNDSDRFGVPLTRTRQRIEAVFRREGLFR